IGAVRTKCTLRLTLRTLRLGRLRLRLEDLRWLWLALCGGVSRQDTTSTATLVAWDGPRMPVWILRLRLRELWGRRCMRRSRAPSVRLGRTFGTATSRPLGHLAVPAPGFLFLTRAARAMGTTMSTLS